MTTTLAAELDERLTGIEASQESLLTKINGLIASVALLDNKVSAIVPAIEASEAELLLGQQALAAAIAGPALYEMKAFQFDNSGESFTVETGLDLDTSGDNVLAPCAVFCTVQLKESVVVVLTNSSSFNSRGFELRFNNGKVRFIAGISGSSQRLDTGTHTAAVDDIVDVIGIWDGSSWEILVNQSVDPISATTPARSSSPLFTDSLRFNDDGDTHNVWAVGYVRGTVTAAQAVAMQNKAKAGNLEEAAEDIAAYNASAGCLVGPTADDDSTTPTGITEHVAGRTTNVQGSPALIDVPA